MLLQHPNELNLSGNLKELIISSTRQILFSLRHGNEIILSQRYDPGMDGKISIYLKDIIHSRLSFRLVETDTFYRQDNLVGDFTADINGEKISFRVIRAGVDNPGDTAANFLTQNFLTWQPLVKPVTYYTPEFLTYYAVVPCHVRLKAYYTTPTGEYSYHEIINLATLTEGYAYTIPCQYAIINAKCGDKQPGYYDIWVEDENYMLSYTQRYYASSMFSENEQWILFENSLGGIDTFRAYGSADLQAEHTHNIAEIEEISSEYRIDTERTFQKNTGHLDEYQRRWLLDFFPSQKKYIYTGNYLRSIVVTESDVKYTDKDLPSNYRFTYKYADAKPFLNLPRTQVPPSNLNIAIPDLGSFSVPPRLVEFPRLPLSEGALFPVQSPYSEEWSTATAGSIADFVSAWITGNYQGGGGVGHKHDNLDLLQLLSYEDGYLKVNLKDIKVGFADETGVARLFETVNFINSISAGRGAGIDADGNAQVESLEVRSYLKVLEMLFNRLTVQEGDYTFTEGGTIDAVTPQSDSAFLLKIRKRFDDDYVTFQVDDILYGIYHNTGGFFTSWMRVVNVDQIDNTILVVLGADNEVPAGKNFIPEPGMNLARRGNFTNEERQSSWYLSSSEGQIVFLDKVDNYIIEKSNRALVLGLPENLPIPDGLPINPEQPYIFARGAIIQDLIRIDYQGQVVKDIIDHGEWDPTKQYVNSAELRRQDDVWWINCRWRCIVEKSTIGLAPTWDSQEWVLVSGDKTLALTIESSNGYIFRINEVNTTLVATVWQGKRDITEKIVDTDWSWSRDSGEPVSDTAWNFTHAGIKNRLYITVDDMGNNWFETRRVKFTCNAYYRAGAEITQITNQMDIRL